MTSPFVPSRTSTPIVVPTPRWVRVRFAGEIIASSRRALLLRQYGPGRLPTYYFPQEDVRRDLLHAGDLHTRHGHQRWTIQVGENAAPHAAFLYRAPPDEHAALRDHFTFHWAAPLAWYEEDDQVFIHARDPYHRVDVLRSSRHIHIAVEGQTLAESSRPYLLFETTLPTRYYLPPEDVRLDLLETSDTVTGCPYKGVARYWSLRVGDRVLRDIAWSYPSPIPENPRIAGLVAFYNERVDLTVDGELQPRPRTPWSRESETPKARALAAAGLRTAASRRNRSRAAAASCSVPFVGWP